MVLLSNLDVDVDVCILYSQVQTSVRTLAESVQTVKTVLGMKIQTEQKQVCLRSQAKLNIPTQQYAMIICVVLLQVARRLARIDIQIHQVTMSMALNGDQSVISIFPMIVTMFKLRIMWKCFLSESSCS